MHCYFYCRECAVNALCKLYYIVIVHFCFLKHILVYWLRVRHVGGERDRIVDI